MRQKIMSGLVVAGVAMTLGFPLAQENVAEIEQVKANLYVITGGGGNTAALVADDGVAAGGLHVLARLRAQPLPGPVHLLRRQPEDLGAAPHVDGAAEVQARRLRGVEDAGPQQRGRMGGQQALEMRGARLGETHVDDDPHVDIVPPSGPGVRDGPPRMA